jgi:hypothetical protein
MHARVYGTQEKMAAKMLSSSSYLQRPFMGRMPRIFKHYGRRNDFVNNVVQ